MAIGGKRNPASTKMNGAPGADEPIARRIEVGDAQGVHFAIVIVLAFAIAAGCSIRERNPAAAAIPPAADTASFTADPQVREIVTASCFDCHAEAAPSAWYVRVAPSYWFSDSARQALNFSQWGDYDAARQAREVVAIGRVVTRGQMPPWDYTVVHPAASLTNEQKDIVNSWTMRETTSLLPAH